jgi:hypothetical protein
MTRMTAGESHMEFFDSFPIRTDRIGFENFPPKASAILKLRRLGFGKSYAMALRMTGRRKTGSQALSSKCGNRYNHQKVFLIEPIA